jgi:Tol biopolymer transport system component
MKNTIILSAALLVSSSLVANEIDKQALTIEKLTQLDKIHSVALSPAGDHLIYGVTTPQGSNLHILNTNNNQSYQLTSHPSYESSVTWKKDGKGIYFLADRSGSSQIWQMTLGGGEATQVTQLPLDITGYKLSPDNKKICCFNGN